MKWHCTGCPRKTQNRKAGLPIRTPGSDYSIKSIAGARSFACSDRWRNHASLLWRGVWKRFLHSWLKGVSFVLRGVAFDKTVLLSVWIKSFLRLGYDVTRKPVAMIYQLTPVVFMHAWSLIPYLTRMDSLLFCLIS